MLCQNSFVAACNTASVPQVNCVADEGAPQKVLFVKKPVGGPFLATLGLELYDRHFSITNWETNIFNIQWKESNVLGYGSSIGRLDSPFQATALV